MSFCEVPRTLRSPILSPPYLLTERLLSLAGHPRAGLTCASGVREGNRHMQEKLGPGLADRDSGNGDPVPRASSILPLSCLSPQAFILVMLGLNNCFPGVPGGE